MIESSGLLIGNSWFLIDNSGLLILDKFEQDQIQPWLLTLTTHRLFMINENSGLLIENSGLLIDNSGLLDGN